MEFVMAETEHKFCQANVTLGPLRLIYTLPSGAKTRFVNLPAQTKPAIAGWLRPIESKPISTKRMIVCFIYCSQIIKLLVKTYQRIFSCLKSLPSSEAASV
jgi:hypothetical protein